MTPLEVADHEVRRLVRDDVKAIHQLFDECRDFFRLIQMEPGVEAAQILDDVPVGKCSEDKMVFGISSPGIDDQLVGLVELLRGYPTAADWSLGLLVIEPAFRSSGLGAAIASAVIKFAHASGAKTLHLVVHEQNPAALRFWQRFGFVIRDKVSQPAAHGVNQIHRLVLALDPLRS